MYSFTLVFVIIIIIILLFYVFFVREKNTACDTKGEEIEEDEVTNDYNLEEQVKVLLKKQEENIKKISTSN